jgi:hypothetical protein
MLKLIILIMSVYSIKSFAIVTNWKEYQIPYNYIISNDLKARKCGSIPRIINEIKTRNKIDDLNKIRTGDYLQLPICNNVEALSVSNDEDYPIKEKPRPIYNFDNIVEWKKYKVEKGYILSKDLVYQKSCNLIWTKQIGEFQKKNPKIKNPNVLIPNKEIWVQKCKNEELIKELTAKGLNQTEIKEIQEKLSYLIGVDFRFDAYLGVSYLENLGHLGGLGVRGNVFRSYGFELKFFNFDQNFLLQGEFELKDPNNFRFQYNLTLGVIDYMVTDVESSSQSSGTMYATFGYIFRPSAVTVFELEAGTNLSNNLGFIGHFSGMKKLGKSTTWAGLFLESRTLNTLQESNQNLILGGLKLSF